MLGIRTGEGGSRKLTVPGFDFGVRPCYSIALSEPSNRVGTLYRIIGVEPDF